MAALDPVVGWLRACSGGRRAQWRRDELRHRAGPLLVVVFAMWSLRWRLSPRLVACPAFPGGGGLARSPQPRQSCRSACLGSPSARRSGRAWAGPKAALINAYRMDLSGWRRCCNGPDAKPRFAFGTNRRFPASWTTVTPRRAQRRPGHISQPKFLIAGAERKEKGAAAPGGDRPTGSGARPRNAASRHAR